MPISNFLISLVGYEQLCIVPGPWGPKYMSNHFKRMNITVAAIKNPILALVSKCTDRAHLLAGSNFAVLSE